MATAAAFQETRRYAAYLGATVEFSKCALCCAVLCMLCCAVHAVAPCSSVSVGMQLQAHVQMGAT